MVFPHSPLTVNLWDSTSKTNLIAEWTAPYQRLTFSTALHGGFRDCDLVIPMSLEEAWLSLNREHLPGYHFYLLQVLEGPLVVWEGRVMRCAVVSNAGFQGLHVKAFGYWSSLRDQYYDDEDGTSTNWASTHGGSDDVIRDMVPTEAPDISSSTAEIDANTNDLVGITELHTRDYPQNHIIKTLAPTADTGEIPWYAAVWEDRIFHWHERAVATVDWFTRRSEMSYRLEQDATHLRNAILPVKAGTEGTVSTNTDSLALYPRRELKITVPAGVSSTVENDMRDTVLATRAFPRQSESFEIRGQVWSARAARHLVAIDGARVEMSKYWLRAGDVLRVDDFVPGTISTTTLDALRTFYVLETTYNATTDTLVVVPDRPSGDLATLLSRRIQIESDLI